MQSSYGNASDMPTCASTVSEGDIYPIVTHHVIPQHIAIIMDGNGRWAKAQHKPRLAGHRAGAEAVRQAIEGCMKAGVRYLTLFNFSTENWKRSSEEVQGLMQMLSEYLQQQLEDPELFRNKIRLRAIGELDRLPMIVRHPLRAVMAQTKDNDKLDLILALSYGGREDIVQAVRSLAKKIKAGKIDPRSIDNNVFSGELSTAGIPDPDLLIRSSGEMRISNFLLWQLAYTEIVVIPEFWPEFNIEVLNRCIAEYQKRERRFGLTSEQIQEIKK